MFRAKSNYAGKRTKRNAPRGARPTAPLRKAPGAIAIAMAGIAKLVAVIPWQRGVLHLSIFSFWLVVLSGLIIGARWIDQPITRIEVAGDLKHLRQQAIRDELGGVLHQSFFTLNLAAIQQQLEVRPWVKNASVERQWPNLLRVSLTEEKAVALWGAQGFINPAGEVIIPDRLPSQAGLPVFYGPRQQAGLMLTTLQQWQTGLASVGLEVATLSLQPRGAWQVGFPGNWTLKLGKADVEGRLQRFITLFGNRLYQDIANIQTIDARYTQGVAVAWKVPPGTALEAGRG